MLPQRFETWLSATFRAVAGMSCLNREIVWRLKMPCRKSLQTTTSAGVSRSASQRVRVTRSEIGRLSTRSTWSSLYPSVMNRSFRVVGRVRSMMGRQSTPDVSSSRKAKVLSSSSPRTVEKETVAPAALTCRATPPAPPVKRSERSSRTLKVGDFGAPPRRAQWL